MLWALVCFGLPDENTDASHWEMQRDYFQKACIKLPSPKRISYTVKEQDYKREYETHTQYFLGLVSRAKVKRKAEDVAEGKRLYSEMMSGVSGDMSPSLLRIKADILLKHMERSHLLLKEVGHPNNDFNHFFDTCVSKCVLNASQEEEIVSSN